ncbi:MAG: hypothetical protein CFE25_15115 [Chitinophagaceae bacterium BSSC1]|nr:MAG: hypothetical protein CFE25_15115 [Chitinophagaceae bacterium BSSC1]
MELNNKHIQRIFIITILVFLFCVQTRSQTYSNYNKVEGLNSNVVYCIMQDSKGYVWVGTEAGAARYDGNKFLYFSMEDGLTDNDVFQIHEDQKGRIWFLTNSGKPCVYENDKILNGTNTLWLSKIQPKKLAKSFLIGDNNDIWFSTLDTVYHFRNDQLVDKIYPENISSIDNNCQGVFNYKDSMFVLTNKYLINCQSKKKLWLQPDFEINVSYVFANIIRDKIFYFSKNKLIEISLNDRKISEVYSFEKSDNGLIVSESLNSDSIFISSRLGVFEKQNGSKKVIKKSSQYNLITKVLKDNEGNIWLTSLSEGLYLKKKFHQNATTVIDTKGRFKIGASNSINKINNKVFIGYNDGNYIVIKNGNVSYERLQTKDIFGKSRQIINTDKGQWFVFGTQAVLKKKGGEFKFPYPTKQISQNSSSHYFASSFGLFKQYEKNSFLNPSNKGIYDYSSYLQISKVRANVICELTNDSVVTGGIYGIDLYVKDKKIDPLPWKSEITEKYISKIIKTSECDFVISSTNFGVGIAHKDSIYQINKTNGLLSNICNSVFSNSPGIIWVATSLGLNKIKYQINPNRVIDFTIENYTYKIRNSAFFCNDVAVFNDSLFVLTPDGTYIHEFSKDYLIKNVPKNEIEGIYVGSQKFSYKSKYFLESNQNNLKIKFIGISFQSNEAIQYKYKLLPYDTSWNLTENTVVEYPHLDPGEYKFLVTSSLSNGIWNPKPIGIAIQIKKPFYNTFWFLILSIISFCLFAYLLFRFLIKRVHEKNSIINKSLELQKDNAILHSEKLVYLNKLIELEQKALSLQMNPHFIFNVINAIKGLYSNNEKFVADNYVDKFAKLMRMILDNNSTSFISLNDELEIQNSYIELALLRYEQKFQCSIKIDPSIDMNSIYLPPMLLQPFIENAIIHGVAPLKSNGFIFLNISISGDVLIFELIDNGIGRDKSKEINKYKIHESKGIHITSERLKLLHPQSKLIISDIVSDLNQVCGTKVYIEIPFKRLKYDQSYNN